VLYAVLPGRESRRRDIPARIQDLTSTWTKDQKIVS